MFLQAAALGKQLFDITDSELALGLLGLVEFLPALILLPLTGSAADRFDRRRVAAIGLSVEALTRSRSVSMRPRIRRPACRCSSSPRCSEWRGAFVAPSTRSLPPLLAPTVACPA